MSSEPKPIMWKVNDAALVPWHSNNCKLCRVVAIDDQGGHPVCKISNEFQADSVGTWRRIGTYRRSWFGYKFIPNDPWKENHHGTG